jgi:hypothetical protein
MKNEGAVGLCLLDNPARISQRRHKKAAAFFQRNVHPLAHSL